jgi:uncharacterized membrane protein HdeD (DUF308 family)
MNPAVLNSWWIFVVRGVIALVFGLAAFFWPGFTLLSLVGLFAAFAILGGASWIIGAIRQRRTDYYWWLVLLTGIVSVAAGIMTLVHPELTAVVLVLIIGANAIVTGVLELALAVRLRREISSEWLLGLSGFLAIAFGSMVFLYPTAGVLAIVWLFSFYATVTGALLLALGLRVRALTRGASRAHVARGADRRRRMGLVIGDR